MLSKPVAGLVTFRLVIVEDIPFYREYLAQFCVRELRYDVVGTCSSVAEGRVMVGRERPDLVLLDVCLGEEHGFDLVEWMAQECPRVRCALMSAHCTSAMALRAAKASICGFIDKTYAGMEQFAAALRCLAQGDSYYSASYTEMLRRLRMDQRGYDKLLTDREQEVLALVGCGWSDEAISDSLGMALATAQTHRRNIMAKLGINNAPKLMRYAIDRGLTQFPQKSTESIALIY